MDDALDSIEGTIQSDWFKAAHEVTSKLALGRAGEGAWNFEVLSEQDEKNLRYVHHALAKINTKNYQHLVNGEPVPEIDENLRGKELDYALVELEQKNVSRFTKEFFKINPSLDQAAIMDSISRASDPTSVGGQVRELFGNGYIKSAMESQFEDGSYDAGNEEHRIRLGKAIIDIIREERQRSNTK